jgi:hypothetical protein
MLLRLPGVNVLSSKIMRMRLLAEYKLSREEMRRDLWSRYGTEALLFRQNCGDELRSLFANYLNYGRVIEI